MDPLYGVFAEHARKYGLDHAIDSFASLPADQVALFRAQFEQDLARVEEGGPPIITAGREDWYAGPVEQDRFWPSLRQHFVDHGWPDERIRDVDAASNTIVGHTPRPTRTAWDAKGLVVGYVQSGKTTNFISAIAKMADVDYRMIIVLSGVHNGLRRQTQERVDDSLSDLNPHNWFPLTDDTRDFLLPTQDPSAILSSNKVVLAVVKKNQAVLSKLIRWLDTPNGKRALQSAPALIIDDEADQASVATKRINPLIRRLLGLMPKCTYIGYTATPFANVFIDPTEDNLYPRSFILNLPRPVGYFGPEKIFGRQGVEGEGLDDGEGPADGYDMVRTVPETDVSLLRPGSKEPATDFTPTMTDELVEAVYWFWLATAARRARGQVNGHSTMLIHTSVKTAVHESYRAPLESLRAEALRFFEAKDVDALAYWRNLWNRESRRVPASDFGLSHCSFDAIHPLLGDVVAETKVVLDNYRSQDRLDYSEERVVAIAVGGNTLSRGLTLEGLVVSFFIRGATAYDTLLQMGRWFGYRRGYEDLPRIWMTPTLKSAFCHLATVEYEMRDDIDRYQRENLTPSEVAVRILTHPALRITAKMGAAQPAYISYAGRRLQTRYFYHQDPDWLANNLEAADHLIRQAATRSEPAAVEPSASPKYLIRDIPVGLIKDFLSRYQVHKDSPDLDTELMIRYMDEQLASDPPSLETWSVAVVSGDGPGVRFGGIDLCSVRRSRLNDGNGERADIKTLMSKEDRAIDLSINLSKARKCNEGELIKLRNQDEVHRNRGLLVLYPIDATSRPEKHYDGPHEPPRIELDADGTVAGFGIVFPGDVKTKSIKATYVAVDLTDVESDDLDEALGVDTEELV